MKRIAVAALMLSACVPTQNTPGQITAFNGASVTIRGAGDFSLANAGSGFRPTAAMQTQAEATCPGARFVSGVGIEGPAMLVDYLFICP